MSYRTRWRLETIFFFIIGPMLTVLCVGTIIVTVARNPSLLEPEPTDDYSPRTVMGTVGEVGRRTNKGAYVVIIVGDGHTEEVKVIDDVAAIVKVGEYCVLSDFYNGFAVTVSCRGSE